MECQGCSSEFLVDQLGILAIQTEKVPREAWKWECKKDNEFKFGHVYFRSKFTYISEAQKRGKYLPI